MANDRPARAKIIKLDDDTAWWATFALQAFIDDAERSLSTASSQRVQYADSEIRQTREYLERAAEALAEIERQTRAA